jgi:hypothetical protein
LRVVPLRDAVVVPLRVLAFVPLRALALCRCAAELSSF